MKKKLLLITMAMMFGLCSCGEAASKEPETKEEEISAEPEAKEEAVSDKETVTETESISREETAGETAGWKEAYNEIVTKWDKEHKNDQSVGYELINMDEDDIPELVLICDDDAWYALDIYTFTGEKASHLQTDENSDESSYLSPGCQGKADAYIENAGIYLKTGGMMGTSITSGYKMEGEKLTKIFEYIYSDASWDEENTDPYSYSLEYTPEGKETVSVNKSISEDDEFYDVESIPEAKDLETEYGFSFASKKIIDQNQVLTFDEISEKLK